MNLLDILSDKHRFELALSLATQPGEAGEDVLLQAGIPVQRHEAFREAVQILRTLREAAGCAECRDPEGCMDDNLLAEFVDGVLSREELEAVERQLAHCAACLRKAVALAELAHELLPAPTLAEVVVGIARRGLRVLAYPGSDFALHPLRPVPVLDAIGETTLAQRWSMAQGGIHATFTLVAEDGGTATLELALERDGKPLEHGQVALRQEGLLLEALPLPAEGGISFQSLAPARYTLEWEDFEHEHARFVLDLREIA
jgi:hypothetical protein